MNAPIGVFDSGVGGLTVVKEIMRQLPAENLVYFGDTARVPYGSKSQKTVCKYSKQIVRFLQTKQVKAIVVACNTASALALDEMKHLRLLGELLRSLFRQLYRIGWILYQFISAR